MDRSLTRPLRRRRLAAGVAALLLAVGIGGAAHAASGGGTAPNAGQGTSARLKAAIGTIKPGSAPQFVPVAPCRIVDTRVAGGALVNTTRTFSAFAPYTTQGGNSAGCGIPSYATALQVNLGAVPRPGSHGYLTGWAFGTSMPLASLVNYDATGPVANMVTLPITAGASSFNIKATGSVNVIADVAGYWAPPLYAFVSAGGGIYGGVSSGVVSATHDASGVYTVTFDRDVTNCAVKTSDVIFASNNDVSAEAYDFTGNPDQVKVEVTSADNTYRDTYFYISLSC